MSSDWIDDEEQGKEDQSKGEYQDKDNEKKTPKPMPDSLWQLP